MEMLVYMYFLTISSYSLLTSLNIPALTANQSQYTCIVVLTANQSQNLMVFIEE